MATDAELPAAGYALPKGSDLVRDAPAVFRQNAEAAYTGGTRDTGWRDVSGLMINGWTATRLRVRRLGNVVFFQVAGLDPTAATSNNFLPGLNGFTVARAAIIAANGTGSPLLIGTNNSGDLATDRTALGGTPTSSYYASEFNYTTTAAWPATLPGTPA